LAQLKPGGQPGVSGNPHPVGGLSQAPFVCRCLAQQALDAGFITPRLLGDKVGLHPVAIIASFLIFGQLFGFFGVLLAVPLSTIVKVLLAHGVRFYKQSWVYSDYQSTISGGGK